MIFAPKTMHGVGPTASIRITLANMLNYFGDLSFILVLIVMLIEFRTDRHHVGQGPSALGEVKHLSLYVAKLDAILSCLGKYSINEVCLCVTYGCELLHGWNYRAAASSGWFVANSELSAWLTVSRRPYGAANISSANPGPRSLTRTYPGLNFLAPTGQLMRSRCGLLGDYRNRALPGTAGEALRATAGPSLRSG